MAEKKKITCDLCKKSHEVQPGDFYSCTEKGPGGINYIVVSSNGDVHQTSDFKNVKVLLGLN